MMSQTKSFLDGFKKRLGPRAEEKIAQDDNIIQDQRQRLAETENQERQTNALVAEKEKKEQEVENLRQKLKEYMLGLIASMTNMAAILKSKQK